MAEEKEEGAGKKVLRGAGAGVAAVGRGTGTLIENLFGNERVGKCGRGGMLIGMVIGIIVGLVFVTNIVFPLNILVSGIIGAALGLAIGWIWGAVPPGAMSFVVVILVFGGMYIVMSSGLGAPVLAQIWPSAEEGWAGIKEGVWCVFHMKECVAEPFYKGWGTETKEEDVSLDVTIDTTHFYDDGEEKKVEAEITVLNKIDGGVDEFSIEPECYIDEKKVDANIECALKEDNKCLFLAREVTQAAGIECSVPAAMIKDKDNIEVKIKLVRPVKASADWTLTTLSSAKIEELASEGKSIPGENDPKGKTVKYSGVPYSFGIGITPSLPLSEGEYELKIELVKESELAGRIIKINSLSVKGNGETAYIDSCEGFTKKGDEFILESTAATDKSFECKFEVDPEDDENKFMFESSIEFDVEIEKKASIIIFKEEGETA